MTQATDTDIRELKSAIEDNNRQIAQLATEMRVGFANVDTKFANVDTKLAEVRGEITEVRGEIKAVRGDIRGEIKAVRGDIKALDNKFDERTKGFAQRLDNKEFIIRSTIAAVLSGLLLTFTKFLFFGLTP
jgi:peptidoglycan hydrolase CwlO-like protein